MLIYQDLVSTGGRKPARVVVTVTSEFTMSGSPGDPEVTFAHPRGSTRAAIVAPIPYDLVLELAARGAVLDLRPFQRRFAARAPA